MFRHHPQLRSWAGRMVVLWLFGVGIANACLAPNVVGLPDGTVQTSAGHPGSHHSQHGQGAQDSGPTASPNCQDFCDKVAVSIPPLKSTLDQVQGHALAPSAASTAAPLAPVSWLQPWLPRRDGVWAPPIPIAFLRLAL
jgi:hypothetical protein